MNDAPSPRPNPFATSDECIPAAGSPSLVRYGVLGFLGAMTFILYIDRVCISQAAEVMKKDLGIANDRWGWVLGAFIISYALFEVPTGHLGDRWGGRGILTRIVLWWSAFTILTGLAQQFWMLLVVRFLFGAGEAGALPNAAGVLRRWFPEASRATAQGLVITCMMLGGAAAPWASALLIEAFGWRTTFFIFGLLGVVWAGAFWIWFRDDPTVHPGVNDAERQLILDGRLGARQAAPPIPWGRVFRNRNVWLMGILMTCSSAVYYMMISWYSSYLQSGRGLKQLEAGKLTSLVLAGGAIGCLCGGPILDWLIRATNNRRLSRAGLAFVAFCLGAVAMHLGVRVDTPWLSAVFVSLACLCLQLQIPAWWSTVTQISGRHVGAMFGLMNSLGVPGALGSQVLPGYITAWMERAGHTGRACWDPVLYCYGGIMIFAGCVWWWVNPDLRIDDE